MVDTRRQRYKTDKQGGARYKTDKQGHERYKTDKQGHERYKTDKQDWTVLSGKQGCPKPYIGSAKQ